MKARILGIVTAGLLVLAACGGDGDSDDAEGDAGNEGAGVDAGAYVDAMVAEGGGGLLDDGQVECRAQAVVDVIGVDALEGAGITPEELGAGGVPDDPDLELPDDAEARLADALGACDGVVEAMEGYLLEGFGPALPDGVGECVREVVDDEAMAAVVAAVVLNTGDGGFDALMASAASDCPGFATGLLTLQLESATGEPATPEDQACIVAFVEANGHRVDSLFAEDPGVAGDELMAEFTEGCVEAREGS